MLFVFVATIGYVSFDRIQSFYQDKNQRCVITVAQQTVHLPDTCDEHFKKYSVYYGSIAEAKAKIQADEYIKEALKSSQTKK